ncbi:hypothetical protein NL676_029411 [Syzygium grande]|nr:hypothetical protein NL676_029411 [Syzygium grande]
MEFEEADPRSGRFKEPEDIMDAVPDFFSNLRRKKIVVSNLTGRKNSRPCHDGVSTTHLLPLAGRRAPKVKANKFDRSSQEASEDRASPVGKANGNSEVDLARFKYGETNAARAKNNSPLLFPLPFFPVRPICLVLDFFSWRFRFLIVDRRGESSLVCEEGGGWCYLPV